jgi:hypothetical protein
VAHVDKLTSAARECPTRFELRGTTVGYRAAAHAAGASVPGLLRRCRCVAATCGGDVSRFEIPSVQPRVGKQIRAGVAIRRARLQHCCYHRCRLNGTRRVFTGSRGLDFGMRSRPWSRAEARPWAIMRQGTKIPVTHKEILTSYYPEVVTVRRGSGRRASGCRYYPAGVAATGIGS